ncbi:MAG: hypothetical protein LBH90_03210, partial [Tannerella sp.]|nr:hypothetical protein [Tannerella sp.]
MTDYIPRKDSELVAWSANFTQGIAENATAWGISADEVSALQTAGDTFAALHAKAGSPTRNSVIVAEKNAARKTLEANIRALAGFRLKNPVIPSAARIALGLRVRDLTLSTIPVPATRPELDVEVLDVRRLKIHFHDMGSAGRARPRGISGAIIAFALPDAPPSGVNALTRNVLATRTPHTLEFT